MKLDKFCKHDDLRPVMNYIQCKAGYLYATDAHIAAKVKAESIFPGNVLEALPDEFYINANEWKALFNKPYVCLGMENKMITSYQKKGLRSYAAYLDVNEFMDKVGKYPDIDFVLTSLINSETLPVSQIGLNLKFAQRINEAFDTLNIRLEFKGEKKGILAIDPSLEREAIAIIMPVGLYQAVEDFDNFIKKFAK
jgi:hypothetical protein